MFVWGALKRGVPNSVRFCIDDFPMYIFFIPTHPYKISSWVQFHKGLLNIEDSMLLKLDLNRPLVATRKVFH